MDLIIDFDGITDPTKKDWLLDTLRIMNIKFHTAEKRQTIEEYNQELAEGEADYEKGNFITTDELKKRIKKW
jgi:predicted transcriptional regulator